MLVERGEVALIDAHLAVNLVAGGDFAIGEPPCSEWVRADVDEEVEKLLPLAVSPCADGDGELAALVVFQELPPFVEVEVGIFAIGVYAAFLRAFHHDVDDIVVVIGHGEVERCDAHGDGHPHVVGVDVGLLASGRGTFRTLGACHETQHGDKGGVCQYFLHWCISRRRNCRFRRSVAAFGGRRGCCWLPRNFPSAVASLSPISSARWFPRGWRGICGPVPTAR